MIKLIKKKFTTLIRLLCSGNISNIIRVIINPLFRIIIYRIDKITVDSYQNKSNLNTLKLICKTVNPEEMKALFNQWPDSQEELIRHKQVYNEYGFKTCFVFYNEENNEPVHFQFLITHKDLSLVEQALPIKMYSFLKQPNNASQEWIYTFNNYRKMGVANIAMNDIISYCNNNNIHTIYSHRGIKNFASIRMAEKIGYKQVSTAYQWQFLKQKRHQGFYMIKTM